MFCWQNPEKHCQSYKRQENSMITIFTFLIWRKITLKVNKYPVFTRNFTQSSITPRKKTKIKKIFLILISALDQLLKDTTHISLRWIYRSGKIDWTKKIPFEYIVPPPTSGVGTIKLCNIYAKTFSTSDLIVLAVWMSRFKTLKLCGDLRLEDQYYVR